MKDTPTIFALSSGAAPSAIGVIRVSGPQAGAALAALAGRVPEARRASLAKLRDGSGALLDEALVLWFPVPNTATVRVRIPRQNQFTPQALERIMEAISNEEDA